MSEQSSTGTDARREPRAPMTGQVTIAFDAGAIVGPGQNISAQGVFFVAAGPIPVRVSVDGSAATVPGELVRVESMGEGKVGIAVRFLAPNPAWLG